MEVMIKMITVLLYVTMLFSITTIGINILNNFDTNV